MQKLKRKTWRMRLGNILETSRQSLQMLGVTPRELRPLLRTAALIVLFLLIFSALSGCTTVKTVKPPMPPQAQARPLPPFHGQTYRDAILYLIEVREWGMSCEADKSAIRRMYK